MWFGLLKYVWVVVLGYWYYYVKDGIRGDVNFGLFIYLWDYFFGIFVINFNEWFLLCDGELGIGS